MKESVFERLGKATRYAALNEKDKKANTESLKDYRDSYAKAETERAEGRAEEQKFMIRQMLNEGVAIKIIARIARATIDKVKGFTSP